VPLDGTNEQLWDGYARPERRKKPNMSIERANRKISPKKVILMVLLILGNLFVGNVVYNCWTAKKGTPLVESVKGNVVSNFWMSQHRHVLKHGTVTAIICGNHRQCAIINGKARNEGDIINGVQVISINRADVIFEKKGRTWKQKVGQRPNNAWR